MIQYRKAKTLSLIFGILCALALVCCLCFAVTLPTRTSYQTFYGTVTRTTYGYFDVDYLSAVILLAMGTFLGFSVYGSIHVEKKGQKVAPKVEAMTGEVTTSVPEEKAIPENASEEVKTEE